MNVKIIDTGQKLLPGAASAGYCPQPAIQMACPRMTTQCCSVVYRMLAEGRAPGDEPDEVWVLAPHAAGPIARPPLHNWLWVALRSISVLTSAPFQGRGEERADDAATAPPAGVRLRVLHPREQLRGPSLDFAPGKVRAWYEDGLRTARRWVEAPELPLEPELQHDVPT